MQTQRALVIVAAALGVSGGIATGGYFLSGSGQLERLAAALSDPATLIGARSPGARAEGALLQIKKGPARRPDLLAIKGVGHEGTPPKPAAPLVTPLARTVAVAPTEVLFLPEVLPADVQPGVPLAELPVVANSGTGGFLIGPIGGGGAISGGGGSGGIPGPNVSATEMPPAAAVPEPGIWLTLILGFLSIGAGLRRLRLARARVVTGP